MFWSVWTKWTTGIKQHCIKNIFIYLFIFDVFLSFFFFAITPIATPLSYATESKEEERVDDTWMGGAHKMYSKESVFSREALEEIRNCYIKEKDAWRHFFAEINDYIQK